MIRIGDITAEMASSKSHHGTQGTNGRSLVRGDTRLQKRSEERRVGKECRSQGAQQYDKKKTFLFTHLCFLSLKADLVIPNGKLLQLQGQTTESTNFI